MINKELISPKSIVVVGGSNNISKPGGKTVKNLIDGKYQGELYVVNPNETKVQGIDSYKSIDELDQVDLAILVIPAKFCLEAVSILCSDHQTKAFIIISAGFGEETETGKLVEEQILEEVEKAGAALIGPNCIGMITEAYKGVFTTPVPSFYWNGCDLISSSGATAIFIMEAGIPLGLKFAHVFSVGNSIQIGVEDVLEYLDVTFDPQNSSKIKLLYIENIENPLKFFIHASSLIRKGCKIAGIKAGTSEAGSRAATSHTGALATSDQIIRALFRKAGIVYCSGRNELITVASIFNYHIPKGNKIAIITHAGGSAVMLTDALSRGGMSVPEIINSSKDDLLTYLYPGSSVSNPIDFLATGTADQLGIIIDYCEHEFEEIDAMIVVFGSPGLFDVANVYNVLNVKMEFCKKPIYPVLPSVVNAQKEINYFLSKGKVNFPDEVQLGNALAEVYFTPQPVNFEERLPHVDKEAVRSIIDKSNSGFLDVKSVNQILELAQIPTVEELYAHGQDDILEITKKIEFPMVMKVVGPIHKTESKGVVLNVTSMETVKTEFDRLMQIEGASKVLFQPMISGVELFVGANYEVKYGHLIMFGLGGIFIEVLGDVAAGLAPLTKNETEYLLKRLKGYKLIEGYRGQNGVNQKLFIDIIQRIGQLVRIAPEIVELDLNPLIGFGDKINAVDARIKIDREITPVVYKRDMEKSVH
jgi:acetate---CoA ligase (ADP-forming)